MNAITLDGNSLTVEELVSIARDGASIRRDPAADERVRRSESVIAQIVENYRADWAAGRKPATEYGVTTGFGEFKDKPIAPDDLEQLQRNLLLSHSVGVGQNADEDDPSNYYPADVVRGALATRLNAFLKGHSGVRSRLVDIVEAMLHRGVVPLVPLRGSVGASGDLCPLSHLFAVLLGAGRFYVVDPGTPTVRPPRYRPATELAAVLGFDAADLLPTFKEGLALVNGANFSAAMLALAVYDAELLANAADANAALAFEALGGCTRALDPRVHDARGQVGQIASAEMIRAHLEGSRLVERSGAVQDVYSLRCAPQVHGATRDAIRFAREIATRELNAATDNPLFFSDGGEPFDLRFRRNWPEWYDGKGRLAFSAGNFHGQPLALAADFLSIAVAELANIAERRTQTLLDANQNRGLPPNLTTRPGVNSGLMIAQYTAASIVSENKTLAHPASVDSIPTGANAEDHVSMSTWAARKLGTIVSNVEAVLAIEMLVAAQAVEWRTAMIAGVAEAHTLEAADEQATAFAAFLGARRGEVSSSLGEGSRRHYERIRSAAQPVLADRPLADDIRDVRKMMKRAEE